MGMTLSLMNVTVDCDVEPGLVARWWSTALAASIDGDWGTAARVLLPAEGPHACCSSEFPNRSVERTGSTLICSPMTATRRRHGS